MVGTLLRVLLFLAFLNLPSFGQDQISGSEARDYQVAYGLFRDGQYQLAIDEFSRFGELYPGSERRAGAVYVRAECLMNMGKTAEANQSFEAFTRAFPRSVLVPDAHFRIGEILYRQEKYDSAVRRFNEVLEKHPQAELAGEAAYWIGESHCKREEYAKREYDGAIAAYPDSVQHEVSGTDPAAGMDVEWWTGHVSLPRAASLGVTQGW
jgi:TolA-binding protein